MSTAAGVNPGIQLAQDVVQLIDRLKANHISHHPSVNRREQITALINGCRVKIDFISISIDEQNQFCLTAKGLVRKPSRRGVPVPVLPSESIRKLTPATLVGLRNNLRDLVEVDKQVFDEVDPTFKLHDHKV